MGARLLTVDSTARVTGLIIISSNLAGLVVCIGNAVQAPGDWVNYVVAALLFLLLVAWWLTRRWVRAAGTMRGMLAR